VRAKQEASANEPTPDVAPHVGAVPGSHALTAIGERPLPTALSLLNRTTVGRVCTFEPSGGRPCRARPLRDEPYCFWHSPDHAEEAAEARRLGGLRRRREKTITSVYELEGLGSVEGIRRVLDIAVADALALENSIARSRVLIAAAMAAAKLLEVAENETREALLASDLALFRGEGE
jgi:hypothetical protein